MKNREISLIFEHIAQCLEFRGESTFRQNAYRRAARALTDLAEDVEEVYARGDLENVAGIGAGMASKIAEYLETGKIQRYEEARKGIPDTLIELMKIPGLGPKTLRIIHDRLGIENIDQLEAAAREGRLDDLPRLGGKSIENILRGIQLVRAGSGRILLGNVLPVVESIISALREKTTLGDCLPAGSVRRMRESVGDIDILATAPDGRSVIEAFTSLPHVHSVLAKGDTKGSIITGEGLQVDLRVVAAESYGAALQYFTGSKDHNVHLREIARKHGLKINEYGVFRGDKRIAGATEEEVYATLDLPWIPPVLRENRGEIEAAARNRLPRLVRQQEIRGDLHVHSDWSDGHASMEEMIRAAKNMGYQYVAISDHSSAATIAKGLDVTRLHRQAAEIEKLRSRISGIEILHATEMDIRPDATCDFPDDIMAGLDLVIASVHSAMKQDEATMTRRVLAAMENPNVHVIGHPTGRLVGGREALRLNMEAVIHKAAETGTALEINSQPARLDLDDVNARRALDLGAMLIIDTDSHHPNQLQNMRFGVAVAQRAWVGPENVLNTRDIRSFRQWLANKQKKAAPRKRRRKAAAASV